MKVVIVDYGVGNLGSIHNMVSKVGGEAIVSGDPVVIAAAQRLILPGVGHFGYAMTRLTESGLVPLLRRRAFEDRTPFLGICLGMQMMTEYSEEATQPGLGWVAGRVRRFPGDGVTEPIRVPHMGWNTVNPAKSSPFFDPDDEKEYRFYFVHSYYVECSRPQDVLCRTVYGHSFVSAFQADNLFGVQFHPEKSHKFGMGLLRRFLELPVC